MKFDPPLHFSINDGIELEATFFNNTDEIVEWGLLSVDEMMIAFGLYYEGEQLKNDIEELMPDRLILHSNFPNPFNPITNISYSLPENDIITINIYDIKGNHIQTVMDGYQEMGDYNFLWNAQNQSSGLYFVKMKTKLFTQTQKLMLVK